MNLLPTPRFTNALQTMVVLPGPMSPVSRLRRGAAYSQHLPVVERHPPVSPHSLTANAVPQHLTLRPAEITSLSFQDADATYRTLTLVWNDMPTFQHHHHPPPVTQNHHHQPPSLTAVLAHPGSPLQFRSISVRLTRIRFSVSIPLLLC